MSLLIGKALKVLKLQLKDYFNFFFVPLFFPDLASGPYLSLCWALCFTPVMYRDFIKLF